MRHPTATSIATATALGASLLVCGCAAKPQDELVLGLGPARTFDAGLRVESACRTRPAEVPSRLVTSECTPMGRALTSMTFPIEGARTLAGLQCELALTVVERCGAAPPVLLLQSVRRSFDLGAGLRVTFDAGDYDSQFDVDGDGFSNFREVAAGMAADFPDAQPSGDCDMSGCAGPDDGGAPVDDGTTPIDDGSTPIDDGSTPIDDGTTPVDDGGTPIDDGTGSTPTDPCAGVDFAQACGEALYQCGDFMQTDCKVECGACPGLGDDCQTNRCGQSYTLARWKMPDAPLSRCWDGFVDSSPQTTCGGGATFADPVLGAQDGANGPDVPRFDIGTETVFDPATGLRWMREARKGDWPTAFSDCEASSEYGYTDWRLPARIELVSLLAPVDLPRYDAVAFPGEFGSPEFWSAQRAHAAVGEAHHVVTFGWKDTPEHLPRATSFLPDDHIVSYRCVRTEVLQSALEPAAHWEPLAGGRVRDRFTGLTWQGTNVPLTKRTYRQAHQYCMDLADGGLDWRMPTLKELMTIVDTERMPAVDGSLFAAPAGGGLFWTTTFSLYATPACAHAVAAVSMDAGGGLAFDDVGCAPTGLPSLGMRYVRCVAGP